VRNNSRAINSYVKCPWSRARDLDIDLDRLDRKAWHGRHAVTVADCFVLMTSVFICNRSTPLHDFNQRNFVTNPEWKLVKWYAETRKETAEITYVLAQTSD